MLESDCYRIVANPDSQLLQFVEDSAIAVSSKQSVDFGHLLIADNISKGNTPNQSANLSESAENKEEVSGKIEHSSIIPLETDFTKAPVSSIAKKVADDVHQCIKINIGQDRKGCSIIFEANNTKKISHPNITIYRLTH